MRKPAFTLIEVMVSIAIVAVLTTIVFVALGPAYRNSRDTARKAQLDLMRRFLANASCYAPGDGPGDYDLMTIVDEIVAANPEAAKFITSVPKDPRSGTETASGFRYAYASDGHCALYANLENPDAEVTLNDLTAPTPGGGTGILNAADLGPNGTTRYYQISK